MNHNTHDGENKSAPKDEERCKCLICKVNDVIMQHFPGDPKKPIPPEELAEMRDALAKISGTLLLGASPQQMTEFLSTMMLTRRQATLHAKLGDIFESFFSR